MSSKWVHIIGIAGVTTSAMALMFKELGWKVTGSDENIYDPAKSELDNAAIKYYLEFSYKNLIDENGKYPDLVVFGGSKTLKNKELLFAQKQNLEIKYYPQVLEEFVVKENKSIVVVGTYGKTSITSMLIHVFRSLGIEVSYMFGGFTDSLDKRIKPKNENTQWSIIEGDEYMTSRLDTRSKFFYYHPSVLVINSISWDHTDLFKTEEDYINNFKNLVLSMPNDGIIFANQSEIIRKVVEDAKCEVIWIENENYITETTMVGKFNKDNAATVNQVVTRLGLDKDKVKLALKDFAGIKRRLEVRFTDGNKVVIDDFGSSPAKALGTIKTIRYEFPNHKLIIIFEPNEGARTTESLVLYDNVFDSAEKVILPKFREIKNRLTEIELFNYLKPSLNEKIDTVSSDNELLDQIAKVSTDKTVIAFLGSHSFENQINLVIDRIKNGTN